MLIQINTDHNIKGHENLIAQFTTTISDALNRISNHITLLEVHLSEENGHKKGLNDKRCLMEARLEGRQPIAVSNKADTLEQAVDGCTDKLINTIESILGRLRGHRNDGAGSLLPNMDIPGFEQFEY
ncbi:MAG: HPF/RaiA family ribosome-associated protein [bacterium]